MATEHGAAGPRQGSKSNGADAIRRSHSSNIGSRLPHWHATTPDAPFDPLAGDTSAGVVRQLVLSPIEPPDYPITADELDPFRLTTKERFGKGPTLLCVTPVAAEFVGFSSMEHLDPLRSLGIPTVKDALPAAELIRKRGDRCRVLILRDGTP